MHRIWRHDQLCVCTDACICVFTDRHICGQIIMQIVYNEPNGISPSYFNKKENSFKRCSTLKIFRLLVDIRHIIRRLSFRISKLCMGGSLYGIFYFYENSALICCIFQSHSALSKYRKTAMKFVFRFSFF